MVVLHVRNNDGSVSALEFNTYDLYREWVGLYGGMVQWVSVRGVIKRS